MVDRVRTLSRISTAPLICDGDTGYGGLFLHARTPHTLLALAPDPTNRRAVLGNTCHVAPSALLPSASLTHQSPRRYFDTIDM